MSSVYSTEPNTNGKVTLQTSHGPLHIELWSKECPAACRNFIQLCLEGYYNGSPFHRIVPGFCVQAGLSVHRFASPNGPNEAEEGAATVEGGRFGVEVHSRLRFTRRGLLGMAPIYSDPKLAHGSQFFFTLSDAPELNGKATLFGRLVGDSIFNLLRLGEVEVDPKTERPLYAPKIISTQVTSNPFDDIVTRDRELIILSKEENVKSQVKPAVAKKNSKLLSFEEEEEAGDGAKIQSSHDVLNDPKLSKATVNSIQQRFNVSKASDSTPASTPEPLSFLQQMKAAQMKETQRKIAQVEEELGLRPASATSKAAQPPVQPAKPLSALEKHRQRYLESGKAQSAKRKPDSRDEMDTLLKLNSFRSKIQKTKKPEETDEPAPEPAESTSHVDICKLHGLIDCLSCRDTFGVKMDGGPEDEEGWMLHKLVFDRRELDSSIRADLEQLVVIDPRDMMKEKNKK